MVDPVSPGQLTTPLTLVHSPKSKVSARNEGATNSTPAIASITNLGRIEIPLSWIFLPTELKFYNPAQARQYVQRML